MPSNVEIKARITDWNSTRSLASAIADDPKPEVFSQVDTFFKAPNGRLKLRVQKDQNKTDSPLTFSELIAYDRSDQEGPKTSKFSKTNTSDPTGLKAVLDASMGIRGEVSKIRNLFMVDQTRIHLDQVAGKCVY